MKQFKNSIEEREWLYKQWWKTKNYLEQLNNRLNNIENRIEWEEEVKENAE